MAETNVAGFGERQHRDQKKTLWCYAACCQMIGVQNAGQSHNQCWFATIVANPVGTPENEKLNCCNNDDILKPRCLESADTAILVDSIRVTATAKPILPGNQDHIYNLLVREVGHNRLVSFGVHASPTNYGHSIIGFGHKTVLNQRWVHVYDPENRGSVEWIKYPSGEPKYNDIEDLRIHHRIPVPEAVHHPHPVVPEAVHHPYVAIKEVVV